MSNLVGGWELLPMKACDLPEDVATGFAKAFGTLVGATYEPVLYCATQIVNGKNHMIICKQTMATQGKAEHLVKVILNEKFNEIGGDFSIVSIDSIV